MAGTRRDTTFYENVRTVWTAMLTINVPYVHVQCYLLSTTAFYVYVQCCLLPTTAVNSTGTSVSYGCNES